MVVLQKLTIFCCNLVIVSINSLKANIWIDLIVRIDLIVWQHKEVMRANIKLSIFNKIINNQVILFEMQQSSIWKIDWLSYLAKTVQLYCTQGNNFQIELVKIIPAFITASEKWYFYRMNIMPNTAFVS